MSDKKTQIIEETGKRYNKIIFEDDYIPERVYSYQINLRNELINKLLTNRKYKYVVDLGSGTGFHLKTLGKYAERLIATDMSFGALKESKKSNSNCEYIVCDINKLPFKPGTIDLIWIAGVLHHVPKDLDNVIGNNIAITLMKNGVLLIDEPNMHVLNYLNMKLSKADPTGKERPLPLKKIEELLRKKDFTIIESDIYELFSPIGVFFNNTFLVKICNSLDKLLNHSFLKFLLLRWFIYAKKN